MRKTPSKMGKKCKHGKTCDQEVGIKIVGSSGAKISNQTVNFAVHSNIITEGTIFMDLSVLFIVLNEILKCPDCGKAMNSHVDMNKKHGYAHYVSLKCVACDWKYCFYTSKKQGQFYEVNVRAVLAFREIGKGHSAMKTFNKVLNMPGQAGKYVVFRRDLRCAL